MAARYRACASRTAATIQKTVPPTNIQPNVASCLSVRRLSALLGLLLLATACASEQIDPKTIQNPVAATPESLTKGKRLYDRFCEECHGATGHGDGATSKKLAAEGEPKAPDLTDGKWDHGSTDGEIFVDIRDGLGSTMKGLNGRPGIASEDIWNLVNYVRSLGR
jgi:mono/diheme cytochrome c family protein